MQLRFNMKKEDIHLFDWHRILFGEVPGGFFIEVIIRTAIIYIVLMVSMRLMGKRMASQLGRNEMIAMTSLAAAIGVPIQSPDRGILAAVIIAAIVVFIQQMIAKKASQSESFEGLTQDNIGTLVSDGELNLKIMQNTRLTKERVFGQLRNKGIHHLGEVKRLYLEANGTFTVMESDNPVPGLCILPDWDSEFIQKVCSETNELVCGNCGKLRTELSLRCSNCNKNKWIQAVR